MDQEIYIRLPDYLPSTSTYQPGGVYRILKAVYGLNDSPKIFEQFLLRRLTDQGFVSLTNGMFKFKQSMLVIYVDDLLIIGPEARQALSTIQSTVALSDIIELSIGKSVKYLGVNMSRTSAGIKLDQVNYIKEKDLGPQPPKDGQADQKRYSSLLGMLGWLSTRTLPQYLFEYTQLASTQSNPEGESLRRLWKLLHEIKRLTDPHIHLQQLRLSSQQDRPLRLTCFVDGSFQISDYKGQIGHVIFVDGCLVEYKSSKARRVGDSSTTSEAMAAEFGVNRVVYYISLIKSLWPSREIKADLLTDSVPLIRQIVKCRSANPRFQGSITYIKTVLEESNISLNYVHTKSQLADQLTKHIKDPVDIGRLSYPDVHQLSAASPESIKHQMKSEHQAWMSLRGGD